MSFWFLLDVLFLFHPSFFPCFFLLGFVTDKRISIFSIFTVSLFFDWMVYQTKYIFLLGLLLLWGLKYCFRFFRIPVFLQYSFFFFSFFLYLSFWGLRFIHLSFWYSLFFSFAITIFCLFCFIKRGDFS